MMMMIVRECPVVAVVVVRSRGVARLLEKTSKTSNERWWL